MEGGGGRGGGRTVLTRLNIICLKNSSLHYFKLFLHLLNNFLNFVLLYIKFLTFAKIFYLFKHF